MNRSIPMALLALAPLLGGWSSCDQSLTRDPSFDAWCGDHLCSWRTDEGAARQVPTWHRDDFGVELAGDPAQISQLLDGGGYSTPRCLRFEAMTSIDAGASVTLALDFGDDGTIEYQSPVPSTHWESVSFPVTPPTWFSNVRVILRKTGSARAVLAHMRVLAGGVCTDPPLALGGRPLGAPCLQNAECGGGRCGPVVFPYGKQGGGDPAPGTCGACLAASDCAAGQSCGATVGDLGMQAGCVPAGKGLLGARCLTGADCATGTCCHQVCSACCGSCEGGVTCAAPPPPEDGYPWVIQPALCGPGQHLGRPGALCLADADCQGGACHGSGDLQVCWFDGRPCRGPGDCRGAVTIGDVSLDACLRLGVADGRCQ